jgi:hypothetical protein
MSQEISPTDASLSLLSERTADPLAPQHSRGASVELIPDDWNRGAPDHPGDITHCWPVVIGGSARH